MEKLLDEKFAKISEINEIVKLQNIIEAQNCIFLMF